MGCSIMNKKVQMLLADSRTSFSILLGTENPDRYNVTRSALQRPDMSRVQLAALLRKQSSQQRSARSQKTYWDNFMARYITQNANSNAA